MRLFVVLCLSVFGITMIILLLNNVPIYERKTNYYYNMIITTSTSTMYKVFFFQKKKTKDLRFEYSPPKLFPVLNTLTSHTTVCLPI